MSSSSPSTCSPAASLALLNSNPSKPSSIFNKTQPPRRFFPLRSPNLSPLRCRASDSNSSITEFDLYDLLGVNSCSDQSGIKTAYRTLQKRCHPDIAGPVGHDMAIVLNEAYSILSDPSSRLAYDKEQSKLEDLRGYTGKPLYSVWCGAESERRAVFVDEVKCVGCLKCALVADKTFAIESVYGRGRVVAQWADPEAKIQDAIEACPVDCISIVERTDLASLEFLMSKQPRGNVRVGGDNTVGARVSNIFAEVKKFQDRYATAMKKAGQHNSEEMDPRRETRRSAIQAIKFISNWLYWQPPSTKSYTLVRSKRSTRKFLDPSLEKLRAAASIRNQANTASSRVGTTGKIEHTGEYWIPPNRVLPSPISNNDQLGHSTSFSNIPSAKQINGMGGNKPLVTKSKRDGILWRAPVLMGTIAAVVARTCVGDKAGEVKEHIGGTFALSIVNSPWSQVALAWIIWYMVGLIVAEIVEASQQDKET